MGWAVRAPGRSPPTVPRLRSWPATLDRAARAAAEIEALVPGADVEPGVVDLADLSTVRTFADTYLATHDIIDVLINNAGVMACPFGHTVDGFETQFGTNHLGHFLLAALLSPALVRSPSPRVVTLSSAGHSRSDVDLVDPNFETTEYSPWIAYGRSKTTNALFARELARRGRVHGLLSFSVHPGGIVTDLGRHMTDDLMNEMATFAEERTATSRPLRPPVIATPEPESRGSPSKQAPPPKIWAATTSSSPTTTAPTWPTADWASSAPTPE